MHTEPDAIGMVRCMAEAAVTTSGLEHADQELPSERLSKLGKLCLIVTATREL